MLQRLPINPAQVKSDNTSENLLSEIHSVRNPFNLFFISCKKLPKKVYNNIMNLIKLYYKNGYYIYERYLWKW